ncbi:unnamed protein product [Calicophoron daubneyi]|uniref:Carbonic anhydrase n=1 Tax=Calicophoron daubneyi TaxID=300641 RepID=A0AAV2THQ7_CALDB
MAIEHLLRNAVTFSKTGGLEFAKNMKFFPHASAVMISCVDGRVMPSKFLMVSPGTTYIVRNAGNFAPNTHDGKHCSCNVHATFELGCIRGQAKDIIICGHSDCKAMGLLSSIGKLIEEKKLKPSDMSPLEKWVAENSMECFEKLQTPDETITFPLCPEYESIPPLTLNRSMLRKLTEIDKLSQINVLKQMSNVYTQSLLAKKLRSGEIRVHGIWFALDTARLHLFSRIRKGFIPVNDDSLGGLLGELSKL